MISTEDLLRGYLEDKELWTYKGFTLEKIETAGDIVTFEEWEPERYYTDYHRIPLLDIMAWVYGRTL